jgi:UDP-3-O-[3-hydroxymyristoyl] glucosamine N-acyltransferase
MVDARFYQCTGPVQLARLLELANLPELADGIETNPTITGAADPLVAGTGDICFASRPRFLTQIAHSRASAAIVFPGTDLPPSTVQILEHRAPHTAFVAILDVLYPDSAVSEFAHPDPDHFVSTSARIEPEVVIATGAVVGAGAEIGAGTRVGPNVWIGPGVAIGRGCLIGANCVLSHALIGDRVRIHAGAVIGGAGFGYIPVDGATAIEVPQLGRVIIQDGVTIGCNTGIDRGALSDTVIGENTKIDNLVQVAHNCIIGRNCLISGKVGLSGSSVLGNNVHLGAGVVVCNHAKLGDGSIVSARAVVTKSGPANSRLAGYPARETGKWRKEVAMISRLAKAGIKPRTMRRQ